MALRIRCQVERLFGLMKRPYGHRRCYCGLDRNRAQLLLMAINLRCADRLIVD